MHLYLVAGHEKFCLGPVSSPGIPAPSLSLPTSLLFPSLPLFTLDFQSDLLFLLTETRWLNVSVSSHLHPPKDIPSLLLCHFPGTLQKQTTPKLTLTQGFANS